MTFITARIAVIGITLALCACAGIPAPTGGAARPRISFDAARERCGASVAESPAVQSCMRAQGWAYRLPWQ